MGSKVGKGVPRQGHGKGASRYPSKCASQAPPLANRPRADGKGLVGRFDASRRRASGSHPRFGPTGRVVGRRSSTSQGERHEECCILPPKRGWNNGTALLGGFAT